MKKEYFACPEPINEEKLYGFSRDAKEAKQMALELHAARIFDSVEWCDYTAFNEKYRPEVLKK